MRHPAYHASSTTVLAGYVGCRALPGPRQARLVLPPTPVRNATTHCQPGSLPARPSYTYKAPVDGLLPWSIGQNKYLLRRTRQPARLQAGLSKTGPTLRKHF